MARADPVIGWILTNFQYVLIVVVVAALLCGITWVALGPEIDHTH